MTINIRSIALTIIAGAILGTIAAQFRHGSAEPASASAAAAAASAEQSNAGPRSVNDPTLVPLDDALGAVDSAQDVHLSAYLLDPRSSIVSHLAKASSRGATVSTTLTGSGLSNAVQQNSDMQRDDAALHITLSPEPLHIKALVADGQVFLNDRNWGRDSIVLQMPGEDRGAILEALAGRPATVGPLTLSKGAGIAREALLISTAQSSVEFASESFSDNNQVYDALRAALARHVAVTVVVSAADAQPNPKDPKDVARAKAERHSLDVLMGAGAHVRLISATDKIAVVDGMRGFVGSTNATAGVPDQVDWGLVSLDSDIVRALDARFAEISHRE
jgi:hypothetical protein